MSEQYATTTEKEHQPILEFDRRLPDAEHAERLREGEEDPKLKLDINKVRANVHETVQAETQVNPLEDLETTEKAAQSSEPQQINQELRQITLRRELTQIQRKLPRPERVFSKVIHQPLIRTVSEAAGKTVSRPSGLLGGGLVALIGSSSYLYLAKHIGFTYNYAIFLVLFFGGFIVGIALEIFVHMITHSRHRSE